MCFHSSKQEMITISIKYLLRNLLLYFLLGELLIRNNTLLFHTSDNIASKYSGLIQKA